MRKWIFRILIIVFLGIFLFSTGKLLMIRRRYKASEQLYSDAASQFTQSAAPAPSTAAPGSSATGESAGTYTQSSEPELEEDGKVYAPIQVDFDGLLAVNPDIIGWIYCPGTVINYPVVHAFDNELYLEHAYDKSDDPCGTIFSDAANRPGLEDSNIILYGHHMQDMSMFATLKYWFEQEYFDEHPIMWFLTPDQDYRLELYSGYSTDALGPTYTVYYFRDENFDAYIQSALDQSVFHSEVIPDPELHHLVLSTCAYSYEYARTVLHGQLVPIDSAAGKPLPER